MVDIKINVDCDKLLSDYENSKEPDVEDVILLVLNYGKVIGKIMMQEQVFIATHEIFTETDALFYSDKQGPYSQLVADILIKLNDDGKIRRVNYGQGHASYLITERGKEYANEIIKNKNISNEALDKLKNGKCDWDEWTANGIMRYIYRNYPEYTTDDPELKWD